MRNRRRPPLPAPIREAAVTLAMDVAALEAVSLLAQAGVRSILLKGPAVARWLYDDSTERKYNDIDLLVDPQMLSLAEHVLTGAGFRLADAGEHAYSWIRSSDGASIDLHYTLSGAGTPPSEVWGVLSSETEPFSVSGGTVEVLTTPGRALLMALHAAHHGIRATKPYGDLLRAGERLELDTWRRAAQLAERLHALPAFAGGLRLTTRGTEIADALQLPDQRSTELSLRLSTPPPTAIGYVKLARVPGLRRKSVFLLRELVPPRVFMRGAYPIARRGPLGLGAAYAWRPLFLLWHVVPSLRAWRRARRDAR
jgi:hypothetical protein